MHLFMNSCAQVYFFVCKLWLFAHSCFFLVFRTFASRQMFYPFVWRWHARAHAEKGHRWVRPTPKTTCLFPFCSWLGQPFHGQDQASGEGNLDRGTPERLFPVASVLTRPNVIVLTVIIQEPFLT